MSQINYEPTTEAPPPPVKGWGKICITTRLEKQVEAEFVASWTGLLMQGLRKGDNVRLTRGKVAHVAQNENVRAFLLETDCDTFMSLDSDADFEPGFLEAFRNYEPGHAYDLFQAFHLRRAWPPEAIWLAHNPHLDGALEQQLVLGRGEQDLGLVGTHCALIRREVFMAIYEAHGKPAGIPLNEFEWFTYPRHKEMSDEAQFSHEARALGFRLGGTTEVGVNHITRRSIGWNEYQEYLTQTQARERGAYYHELVTLVSEFTGETPQAVMAKVLLGNENVKQAWAKANPQTPDEVRAFYGQADNGYLYDLISWNWNELYWKIIAGLDKYFNETALVIGAGLGTEVTWLKYNNEVLAFELNGVLRDFIDWRFPGVAMKSSHVESINSFYREYFSLIVCIDTLEHIHPTEIDETLQAIADLLTPGGVFYCHNNFKQQDLYPMHFDHSEKFAKWLSDNGMERISDYEYRKPKVSEQVSYRVEELSSGHGVSNGRKRSPVPVEG